MILVGFCCVLGAIGLLVAGLAQADPHLVWASITSSAVGGFAVAVSAVQRGRALRRAEVVDGPQAQVPAATASAPDEPAVAAPQLEAAQPPASRPTADTQGHGAADAAGSMATDLPAGEDEASDPVGEPSEEDVDMADLLLIIDLSDEVLVVDRRPRYHIAVCGHLDGRDAIPLPVNEAREDGFTPCGRCRPDATLAGRSRRARSADY
ncbi:MAG: hypothetical protein M3313_04710 [Actinomycetota bacterium]|nr:hypothetical protein [Actinomycetota bacterium]